ncbi:MAG: hypothetical protein GF329_01215 [Candidatus Lokiarchaeota archaeon]|nr:hypothetical protein [Candidatus Lokiarchaeota archaeon]
MVFIEVEVITVAIDADHRVGEVFIEDTIFIEGLFIGGVYINNIEYTAIEAVPFVGVVGGVECEWSLFIEPSSEDGIFLVDIEGAVHSGEGV